MFFLAFCFSIFNGDCNNPDKIRKISIKFHYYERVTSNNLVNFLMHNLRKSLFLHNGTARAMTRALVRILNMEKIFIQDEVTIIFFVKFTEKLK